MSVISCFFMVPLLLQPLVHRDSLDSVPEESIMKGFFFFLILSSNALIFRLLTLSFKELNVSLCAERDVSIISSVHSNWFFEWF